MASSCEGDRLDVIDLPVILVRPEEGLGRQRSRSGHEELVRSISQFGVLTPITVRPAPDGSGQYLLIKGQGRTLACRLLGYETIPAIVVADDFDENQKVQQFLVENVARLKMKPVDRALLIARARDAGEETFSIAERFGVSATTVRKLLQQLDGASSIEIAALRDGAVSLSVHSVVARHVQRQWRQGVLNAIAGLKISAIDLDTIFRALGWAILEDLGAEHEGDRLALLAWLCHGFASSSGTARSRLARIAAEFPASFENANGQSALELK